MNIVKRVTVYTTSAGSELVADILCAAGSEGVGIYDSEDFKSLIDSDIIWDYVDEGALFDSPVVRVAGFSRRISIYILLGRLSMNLKSVRTAIWAVLKLTAKTPTPMHG